MKIEVQIEEGCLPLKDTFLLSTLFINAIDKCVEVIMVGHSSYPKITNDNLPASLSSVIVNDILRNENDFQKCLEYLCKVFLLKVCIKTKEARSRKRFTQEHCRISPINCVILKVYLILEHSHNIKLRCPGFFINGDIERE